MIFVFLLLGQVFIQTATAVIAAPPAPQPVEISAGHIDQSDWHTK